MRKKKSKDGHRKEKSVAQPRGDIHFACQEKKKGKGVMGETPSVAEVGRKGRGGGNYPAFEKELSASYEKKGGSLGPSSL